MTEELGQISVGLGVNLSKLDADLAKAQAKAKSIATRDYKLNFSVGRLDLTRVHNEVARIVRSKIDVTPTVRVSRASVREFQADFRQKLGKEPIPVRIKANLDPTEVARIRREIMAGLGKIPVDITISGVSGGGGGKGATSTTVTSHEKAVNADLATRSARATATRATPAVRNTPAKGTPVSQIVVEPAPTPTRTRARVAAPAATVAPVTPVSAPAAKKTASVAPAPRAAAAPGTTDPGRVAQIKKSMATYGPSKAAEVLDDMEARGLVTAAERADVTGTATPKKKKAARVVTAPAPRAPKGNQLGDLRMLDGGGPYSSLAGRQSLQGAATGLAAGAAGAGAVERRFVTPDPDALSPDAAFEYRLGSEKTARRLKRQAQKGRTVSPDTLRHRKPFTPETAEEREYAARPRRAGIPAEDVDVNEAYNDAQGKGVRGAGRAGLMRPGEVPLSAERRQDIDDMQDDESARISAERHEELVAPARSMTKADGSNSPYYGKVHPRLQRSIALKQMTAIHPKMGTALEAFWAGDMEGARAHLRGLSSAGPGHDKKQRKRFFTLFKNAEKAPPDVLNEHAGLMAMFKEMALTKARERIAKAKADVEAFPKPKGKQDTWDEDVLEQWQGVVGTHRTAERMYSQELTGTPARRQGLTFDKKQTPAERAETDRLATVPPDIRARKSSLVPGSEGPQAGYTSDAPAAARAAYEALPGVIKRATQNLRSARAKNRLDQYGKPETPPEAAILKTLLAERARLAKVMKRAVGGRVYGDGFASRRERAQEAGAKDRSGTRSHKETSSEDLDRLFGDKPGMWFDRKTGQYAYAHERPTEEERTQEANRAYGSFRSRHGFDGGAAAAPPPPVSDTRSKIDKLRAMADQSVSPNEAATAKRMLHTRGIEGYAAGTPRVHGTSAWRNLSLAQRSRQPWCTYCGSFGSKQNPLQADHIKPLAKGGAPFDKRNLTTACKRCNYAKLDHEGWGPRGRAEGGHVERGLRARIKEHEQGQQYLVGEIKPEAYVPDDGSPAEIIGEHGPEIRGFPKDGKVLPFVPEWVRRQKKNAKDFTPRAAGGTVKKAAAYGGRFAAEPDSGLAGRKVFRDAFDGERAAVAAGGLSKAGGVQRVFVTNWPGGVGGARGGSVGSGGYATAAEGRRSPAEDRVLRDLTRSLRDIRRSTVPKKAELPEAETSEPRFQLTPEQKVSARIESIFGANAKELKAIHTQMQTEAKEAVSNAPVRGAGPALGQITAGVLGRQELLRRTSVAQAALADSARARGILSGEVKAEQERQTELDEATTPEAHTKAAAALEKQQAATGRAADEVKRLDVEAGRAVKSANALGLRAGVFAGNMIGLAGGVVLFSGVLGVAQKAVEYISPSIERLADRFGGFQSKANEVTKTLAEQIRAHQGLVDVTLAEREAAIGLGTATGRRINPLLGQRAQIEAGNQALTEQIDLIHAYQGALKQQGDKRFPIGLTETQGGLNILGFQTGLGGTRSTFEQINEGLSATSPVAPPGVFPDPNKNGGQNFLYEGVPGFNNKTGKFDAQDPWTTLGDILFDSGRDKGAGDGWGKYGDSLFGSDRQRGMSGGPRGNMRLRGGSPMAVERQAGIDIFVTDLNENIKRAGGAMQFLTATTDEQRITAQKQIDALNASGIPRLVEFGEKLAAGNLVLKGVSTDPAKLIADVLQGGQDVATGAAMPDLGQLIKAQEKQIAVQKALFDAEGRHARATTLPAQFAFSQLAAPTPGFKGGPAFEEGLIAQNKKGQSIDPESSKAAVRIRTQVGGAIDYVNSRIDTGKQAMLDLVAPLGDEKFTAFSGLLDKIESTGKQIAGIQIGMQQEQTNLQVAEYNNQLRIANRSLRDAKDLQAAIGGEVHKTVGGLEGANFMLQRQLQLLGFELTQRQINFRVATAGFVAPGTTPEERSARIEAAKTEAAFAQKQLDIQKEIASNQFRSTTMPGGEISRQVTDLRAQIDLLQQARTVTINVAIKGRALAVLQAAQEQFVAEAQTYIEEGQKIVSAQLTGAAQIASATGEAFGKVLGLTAEAWNGFGAQATDAARRIIGALSTGYVANPYGGGGGGSGARKAATGLMFDTSGSTNLTVGEAGKETVAVLRNPRQMSLHDLMSNSRELLPTQQLATARQQAAASGGSGPTTINQITVVITGNHIDKDTNLDGLADEIATKVEERLQRKASLYSLRR